MSKQSELENEPVLMSTVNLEYAIQKWSVDDLKFANGIIVREINHRYELESQKTIMRFRIGQRVKFASKYGRSVEGTIVKINRKTVSLDDCTDGIKWRIGTLDKLEIVEQGAK